MKVKQNISKQNNFSEKLSPFLEKMKHETPGYKVPDGYFDSLDSRIVDRIHKQEKMFFHKTLVPAFRKPLIWAPVVASVVVILFLVLRVPTEKTSTIQVNDEWTELNRAYDESYAEEIFLAESNIIDEEMQSNDVNYIATTSVSTKNEPTLEEITEYLKDQDLDTDILNEY